MPFIAASTSGVAAAAAKNAMTGMTSVPTHHKSAIAAPATVLVGVLISTGANLNAT